MDLRPKEFLRERKQTEDPFISDRIHNPLQYTFYWDPSTWVQHILNFLDKFWKIKDQITSLLEENNENYDEYEEKAYELAKVIDSFDSPLIIILINILESSQINFPSYDEVMKKYLLYNNLAEDAEFDYSHTCDIISEILDQDFRI